MKCVCGKRGDKLCSRCKVVGYCSKECQAADFPKHKKGCKSFAATTTAIIPTISGQNSWRIMKDLPSIYQRSPMANLSPNLPKWPLEQLIPFFLATFAYNVENALFGMCSPAVSIVKTKNKFTIVTCQSKARDLEHLRSNSYKRFNQTGLHQSQEMRDNLKKAFLMCEFCAKCNQAVCCFGLLILNSLQTRQMTYGGERVIGWAVQNGDIKVNHSSLVNLKFVDIADMKDLAAVTQCIITGQPLPDVCKAYDTGRNSGHVWLTFVTESGRIFDLDLSAFQFGADLPFPCIIPVTNVEEPTSFYGICDRGRIMSSNVIELRSCIAGLIQATVDNANFTRKLELTTAPLTEHFMSIAHGVMNSADNGILSIASDPEYFWNTLMSLD